MHVLNSLYNLIYLTMNLKKNYYVFKFVMGIEK